MGATVDVWCREEHPKRPTKVVRLELMYGDDPELRFWAARPIAQHPHKRTPADGVASASDVETAAGIPTDAYDELFGTKARGARKRKLRARCGECHFDFQRDLQRVGPVLDLLVQNGKFDVDLRALARRIP